MIGLLRRYVDLYERHVLCEEAFVAVRCREAEAREREVDSSIKRNAEEVVVTWEWQAAIKHLRTDLSDIKDRLAALPTGGKDG